MMHKPQKTIKINFTLTKEEYAKGALSQKRNVTLGIFLVISASIASVLNDYYIDSPQWPMKLLIHLLFITAGYLLFLFLSRKLINFILYRNYRKYQNFQKPMFYEFSNNGVKVEHSVGNANLTWEDYDQYQCSKDMCLLFITDSRQIIPLRVFNETDKKEFKQLLAQHIKNT